MKQERNLLLKADTDGGGELGDLQVVLSQVGGFCTESGVHLPFFPMCLFREHDWVSGFTYPYAPGPNTQGTELIELVPCSLQRHVIKLENNSLSCFSYPLSILLFAKALQTSKGGFCTSIFSPYLGLIVVGVCTPFGHGSICLPSRQGGAL